jgi:hypothetical protein
MTNTKQRVIKKPTEFEQQVQSVVDHTIILFHGTKGDVARKQRDHINQTRFPEPVKRRAKERLGITLADETGIDDPLGLGAAFDNEPEHSQDLLGELDDAFGDDPDGNESTEIAVKTSALAKIGRVIAEHFTEKSASEGMYHPPTMSSDTPCHQCKNQQLDQYALTHPETGTYRCSYCGMTYSHVCLGTDTDRKEYQRAVFERNDRDDLIRIVERQGPNWVVNTLTAEGYYTNRRI